MLIQRSQKNRVKNDLKDENEGYDFHRISLEGSACVLKLLEYWSELSCSPPGYLPNAQVKPASLSCPALAGEFFTTSATWKAR